MALTLYALSGMVANVLAAESVVQMHKHLGAASCGSTACHGKLATPKQGQPGKFESPPGSNVVLNEYRLWSSQQDRHSQAYRTLQTTESQQIARYLGIGTATNAKICLDCHADNVPPSQRGPKFQIADGVGCEACHGGAEQWIKSHAEKTATHRDNVARGMYPSELPLQRAQLCLSCHLGTKDRLATHAIMAAGHPRLAFELEVFTANQPAHYDVDADYEKRKGKIPGANLWLTGQLESARRLLTLLESPSFEGHGLFPELAFYDCHSCHHPMDKIRWNSARANLGVKPGAVRLQTHSFVVLQAVSEAIEPGAQTELASLTGVLVRAGQESVPATRSAAKQLSQWLDRRTSWASRPFSAADVTKIRKMLLTYAANERTGDYPTAEQIVFGAESLSYFLKDHAAKKTALDALYKEIEKDTNFNPARFAAAAKNAQRSF